MDLTIFIHFELFDFMYLTLSDHNFLSHFKAFILATIIAVLAFVNPGYSQTATSDPIRVGILHSLTGTMAISERSLVDATLLAIEEINKKGGINGHLIQAIVEDGASEPKTFAAKAEKLILKDKVLSIFGCWTSSSRKAVLPVIEKHNTLLWYPVQYEGEEASQNIIYSGATPNQQIFPALDWCMKHLGKRFFLVGSDYIFPREANRLIKGYLAKNGGIVTGEEYLPLGEQNFKNIVKMISADHPDVIFNTVNGDSNIGLFLELYSNSIEKKRIPVMSVSIAEEELRSMGTKLTAGNYCSWTYFQNLNTPENKVFVEAFKSRFGASRVTSDPIQAAYSQVYLFALAAKKANNLTTDNIRNNALGSIFSSPAGSIEIWRANQHVSKYARIGEIMQDGQFNILWSSEKPIIPDPFPQFLFPNGASSQLQRESVVTAVNFSLDNADDAKTRNEMLERYLKSSDKDENLQALLEINSKQYESQKWIGPLTKLLGHQENNIVNGAIDAITRYGRKAKDAIPILARLAASSNSGVRLRSELAIVQLANSARENDDVTYLSDLEEGLDAVSSDPQFKKSAEYANLKMAVRELKQKRRSGTILYLYEIISESTWLKIACLYGFYLIILTIILFRAPIRVVNFGRFVFDHIHFAYGDVDVTKLVRFIIIPSFISNSDRALNGWVDRNIQTARKNFNNLETVRQRSIYIPVPVTVEHVAKADFNVVDIQSIWSKQRWCILIHGEGGTGKTSLACQIGNWALGLDNGVTNHDNHKLMIPVLLEPGGGTGIETNEKFLQAILGQLQVMINSNESLSLPFLELLLKKGRILVIVDDIAVIDETEWALPTSSEFAVSSLVVTSRRKEKLGNVIHSEIQSMKVSGSRLSDFMNAYLNKIGQRDKFTDHEFFKACERLTLMVGEDNNRSITVLFAKMYADQMVGMKETGLIELPHDIPEMMQGFIDELNRNRQRIMSNFDNRLIQNAARVVAWECCKSFLYPEFGSLSEVKRLLGTNSDGIIRYLENELKLIKSIDDSDKVRFLLDPLAEYYASFYAVRKFGNDISQWHLLLDRLEKPDILQSQSRGFILALTDTVHARASLEGVPEYVITKLSSITESNQRSVQKIKIGVLHSMTGTMAISERSLIDAIKLSIKEVNQSGGVLGKEIQAVFEDGASDWNTFEKKARKLILEDGVCSVFGCWTSASRKAVLPVFEGFNNLLWYPIQYEGGEASPNIIYSGAAPNQQIIPAIDYCLNNLGRKIYLVGSDYIFPREANGLIKKYLRRHDILPVGEAYVSLESRDFIDIVNEIKALKPDVIFNTVNGESNMGLFHELAMSGITASEVPVMSVSIAEDELLSIGADLVVGNYCAWNYFQSIDTNDNKTFVSAFKKENGNNRVTDDPIESSYMQIKLFAKAVEIAGTTDPRAIRNAARGLEMNSPKGLIRIDPENQHTWKQSRIGKINANGQFSIVWTSGDQIRPEPFLLFDSTLESI